MIRKRVRIRDNDNFWKSYPETIGDYGFPIVNPFIEVVTFDKVIPLPAVKRVDNFNNLLCFYCDDFQFERFWLKPDRYIEFIRGFKAIINFDFSTYSDMPKAFQIWNVYKNAWLGNYYQNQGINIIPNVTWSIGTLCDYHYKHMPKESVIAISHIGISNPEREIFQQELTLVIQELRPIQILLYGKEIAIDNNLITHIKPFSPKNNLKEVLYV